MTDALWYPYQFKDSVQHHVVSASAGYLKLANGTQVFDAISSWWSNIHGHSNPILAQALSTQALQLEHVMLGGFTHSPAIALAETLSNAVGGNPKVFFSDNGSTAVETALKIAIQYQANLGAAARTRLIALKGAFHGDTFGAMSVSEPSAYHSPFKEMLLKCDRIDPYAPDSLESLLATRKGSEYAALIVEPLIQGAAGMRTYPKENLARFGEVCKRHGILLICDEIFTGFYRTGSRFAFMQAGISPDLICLSKGLTGGMMAMGATTVKHEIAETFFDKPENAFLHGHTFTGNPLAARVALTSWEMLEDPDNLARIKMITTLTQTLTDQIGKHPKAARAWNLGTIGAVQAKAEFGYGSSLSRKLSEMAISRGVLLRPLGNVIYTVPPYCTNPGDLKYAYEVMGELLDAT